MQVTAGEGYERFHSGNRSGHDIEPGDRVRCGDEGRRRGPEGIHPAFPRLRLGRTRPGRDLGQRRLNLQDGAAESRQGRRQHRGHWYHQPARNRRHLGQGVRQANPQRDRLAGSTHGTALHQAQEAGAGAAFHQEDRPAARSVLLWHQDRLAARQGEGRTQAGRARRIARGYDRLVPDLAADRRQGACDRRHKRLADAGLQHRKE
jgi:hypothetical protein